MALDIQFVGIALLASVHEVTLGFLARDLPQRRVVVVQTPLTSGRMCCFAYLHSVGLALTSLSDRTNTLA